MFDIALSEHCDLMLSGRDLDLIEGTQMSMQIHTVLFQTRQGEYFLNPGEGLDFNAFFALKQPSRQAMVHAITQCSGQVRDFQHFEELVLTADQNARRTYIEGKAVYADGEAYLIKKAVRDYHG